MREDDRGEQSTLSDWSPINRFGKQAYDLYNRNRGLLLIGCSTIAGASMTCIVKLMTNLEVDGSENKIHGHLEQHVSPF